MGREIDYSFSVFARGGDPNKLNVVRLRDGFVEAAFLREQQGTAVFLAAVLSSSSRHFGNLQYDRGYADGKADAMKAKRKQTK